MHHTGPMSFAEPATCEARRRWKFGSRGDGLEERGEVCLAEEVERLRRLGLPDEEVASRMGVDASWVQTLISPGEVEPDPESED